MITIWGRRNSINVMKVLWCADELLLDYERIDAGMAFGVVNEDFYRAKNPNAKVPCLEDGERVLWESNTIVRYLAAAYGLGHLCPEDIGQRAAAEKWMDWQLTTPYADLIYLFWGTVRNSPVHQDPRRQAEAIRHLDGYWAIVDRALEGRDYLNGNQLTIADIPLGCLMWRWQNLNIPRAGFDRLEAWHERLKARPAFQKNVMLPLT